MDIEELLDEYEDVVWEACLSYGEASIFKPHDQKLWDEKVGFARQQIIDYVEKLESQSYNALGDDL